MNTNHSAAWRISPEVRTTYSEDGAVLLDINKGICYSLNSVAAQIWVTVESSEAGVTIEDIVDAIETHFKVPRQELKCDTAECLNKLQRMGLVHCNGRGIASKPFGEGR